MSRPLFSLHLEDTNTPSIIKVLSFLSILCILASCKQENQTPASVTAETAQKMTPAQELHPEVAAIAAAHGMDRWDAVEQIAFTFNVDRAGKNVAKRSWIWQPKTNEVTMTTATDTVSYNRNKLDSLSTKADQGFINDKYWLLAPYQIAWDEGTTITTETMATAPLSQKSMKKLTLTYGNDGGYTPGDAYDFYYATAGTIEEWVFRKANAPEPTMITTFEGYKDLEGLLFATDHKDKDGSFRLYFTDVTVQMAGK